MVESPLKACGRCKKEKPLTDYSFLKSANKPYSYCKPCHSEYQRIRNSKNPLTESQKLRQRHNRLWRDFKITLVQYLMMGDLQRWLCAICDRDLEVFAKNTQVDHCHRTGRVRGILCHRCNKALGLFEDSQKRLRQADWYLS